MDIADVPGIRVGHSTDDVGLTGCTVVLPPDAGAVASVDVRGSAPGTRETDLLEPGRLVERVHAVMLCGGSAFGLAAATGAMRWLSQRGVGYGTGGAIVPIVPAAVLFDLATGSAAAFPDADAGHRACEAAGDGPLVGRIGAGTGATYAKLFGDPLPGGIGSAARLLPGGATIGALAAVNALGDVVDDAGNPIGPTGRASIETRLLTEGMPTAPEAANTTLVVVATDAALDKAECRRLASVAHDGFARAIRPVHTPYDGDTAFVMSTGLADPAAQPDPMTLTAATAAVVADAIRSAVAA